MVCHFGKWCCWRATIWLKNAIFGSKIGFLYDLIIGLQILRPLFHINKVYKNCWSATQEAGLLFNLVVTLCQRSPQKRNQP